MVYDEELKADSVRPFDFTGRPMKGWISVEPEGHESDLDLRNWVQMGIDFASGLPAK